MRLPLFLIVCFLLISCGKTGDLYLPAKDSSSTETTVKQY